MKNKELEVMFPQITPPTPLVKYFVGACYEHYNKTLYLNVFNKTENIFEHEIKVFVPNEHLAPLWAEAIAKYFKTKVLYEQN